MQPEGNRPRLGGRRAWMAAGSLALGGLATFLILRRLGIDDLSTLTRIPARVHLVVLGVVALEVVARGARVSFIARGLDLPLGVARSVRAQIAADAWGAVTPSRIGSDPAKIAVLHGSGVDLGSAGALLLAEMIVEATLLGGCAAAIALFVPSHWWAAAGIAGYALAVSLAGVVALGAARMPGADPPKLWRILRLGSARWGVLHDTAAQLRARAASLHRLPVRWATGAFVAGAVHLAARLTVLPLLALPLIAAAGGGETVRGAVDLVLGAFFVLYATALLPPPGGGGGVELAFATVLGGALGRAPMAAALVWWRVYTFYLVAIVGWLSLVVSKKRHHEMSDTGPSHDARRSFPGPSGGP